MVPGVQDGQVSKSLGNEDDQTQAFIHFYGQQRQPIKMVVLSTEEHRIDDHYREDFPDFALQ